MKTPFFLIFLLGANLLFAQMPDSTYVKQFYDKMEVQIPMRDGIKLFTAIYTPKDKSKTYPMLMQRTCYSVEPYGLTKFEKRSGPQST